MDTATTKPPLPVDVPEGTELAFAIATFYCRRSEWDSIAKRLEEEKGAEVQPRFDPKTGEPTTGECKWTENGVRCSLDPAPVFHPLYEEKS